MICILSGVHTHDHSGHTVTRLGARQTRVWCVTLAPLLSRHGRPIALRVSWYKFSKLLSILTLLYGVCIYIYIYVCMYVCMYVYIYIYIYVYILMLYLNFENLWQQRGVTTWRDFLSLPPPKSSTLNPTQGTDF